MKFLSIEFESSSRIKEKVEDLLTLEIVVPKKLTKEETELFQKLQKISKFMPRTNLE